LYRHFLFHAVKVELDKPTLELNITRETYEEFSERVIITILRTCQLM